MDAIYTSGHAIDLAPATNRVELMCAKLVFLAACPILRSRNNSRSRSIRPSGVEHAILGALLLAVERLALMCLLDFSQNLRWRPCLGHVGQLRSAENALLRQCLALLNECAVGLVDVHFRISSDRYQLGHQRLSSLRLRDWHLVRVSVEPCQCDF